MIQRQNLRDQVLQHLVSEIIKGSFKGDETISLAALARGLKVSVTPIREALNQLSRVGVIKAIPNRGFIMEPLKYAEAFEIYPIISRLEALAIENTKYSSRNLERLKLINQQFKEASSVHQAVLRDEQFHNYLIQPYKNETLNRLIKDLKIRVLMYELRFQDENILLNQSFEEHQKIIKSIEQGQLSEAKSLLIEHWNQSMIFIQNKMQK